jgi:HK97 family phage prohead protease
MPAQALDEADTKFITPKKRGDGEPASPQAMMSQMKNDEIPENLRNAGWVTRGDETRRVAYTNLEVRALGEGNTLIGYAAVFDSPSEPMPYTEFVRRGAFAKTLNDGADVRLLIDHEGVPLARTKSGTLALEEDERGLKVEAELDPANPDAMRVLSAMRRGDLSQMSFAFRTIKDSYSEDRSVRELKEVQLYDVSIVTFPAYEETVAELRSRNETANVEVASNILLRKNQVLVAKHKQP